MDTSQLPETKEQWLKRATASGVHRKSVHDLLRTNSASKIGDEQYLALRTLWSTHDIDEEPSRYLHVGSLNRARSLLDKDKTWGKYLDTVQAGDDQGRADFYGEDSSPEAALLGRFESVYEWQDRVQRPNGVVRRNFQEQVDFKDTSPKVIPFDPPHPSSITAESESPTPAYRGTGKPDQDFPDMSALLPTISAQSGQQKPPQTPKQQTSKPQEGSSVVPSPVVGVIYSDPSTESRIQGAREEVIVETALHIFLQSFIKCYLPVKAGIVVPEWSQAHVRLKCADWVAITDGSLRSADSRLQAIVEVKPITRDQAPAKIRKQESAQMAAWICSHPNDGAPTFKDNKKWPPMIEANKKWRLIISQDSFQMWLTFAEYDQQYQTYISNGSNKTNRPSFLKMHEYGPFDMNERGHINMVGQIVLAFMHQQLGLLRKEKETPRSFDFPADKLGKGTGKGK